MQQRLCALILVIPPGDKPMRRGVLAGVFHRLVVKQTVVSHPPAEALHATTFLRTDGHPGPPAPSYAETNPSTTSWKA